MREGGEYGVVSCTDGARRAAAASAAWAGTAMVLWRHRPLLTRREARKAKITSKDFSFFVFLPVSALSSLPFSFSQFSL